ncbi:hypothetical protein Q3G72_018934 [Acer saccharum]|nr:hypothetical protein Q3G72_018934 [Acer saccharum]
MSGNGGGNEGASSMRHPLLTGLNYASWKGTEVVKDSKLHVLQTQFEMLKMEENECFNDFEIKLMDIVNQSHQFGDPY